MNPRTKIVFYSVVPSPYQRDLFYKLSCLPEIDLSVFYLEAAVSDSPWPEAPLQPYEQVMSGYCLIWGSARFHINWHLPQLATADIVVINGYQNLVAQLILHTHAKSVPCLFWGETMVARSGGIKGKLQKLLAKGLDNCAGIVAIGSKAAQDYSQKFPDQPIFNIPYHCNLDALGQALPDRPREPVTLLFCGQMIARKGVDLLLHAFDRLIQQGYSARLLLVGREADLPSMLKPLSKNARDLITYAGFQAPENLPSFFSQADIFILPSRYDGWGVVVNQALGAGLPIICSDAVGAAHDLVEPGVNGSIFPAGDTETLFQSLKGYLNNLESIRSASQASYAKSEQWSLAKGAKRWLTVVNKLKT